MKRFRGGLVFKAHRFVYHSTLGSRVIKKKKKDRGGVGIEHGVEERDAGFRVYFNIRRLQVGGLPREGAQNKDALDPRP